MATSPKKRFRVLKASTLRKIALQTDLNDHGGALLTAAKALHFDDLADQIWAINQRHEEIGHLPPELHTQREELYNVLMCLARQHLSEASYQALYDTF